MTPAQHEQQIAELRAELRAWQDRVQALEDRVSKEGEINARLIRDELADLDDDPAVEATADADTGDGYWGAVTGPATARLRDDAARHARDVADSRRSGYMPRPDFTEPYTRRWAAPVDVAAAQQPLPGPAPEAVTG